MLKRSMMRILCFLKPTLHWAAQIANRSDHTHTHTRTRNVSCTKTRHSLTATLTALMQKKWSLCYVARHSRSFILSGYHSDAANPETSLSHSVCIEKIIL